jgi:hypothetical protein
VLCLTLHSESLKMFAKLALALALVSTVRSVEFQIKNVSPNPVFVQILGTEYPDPFTLQAGEDVSRCGFGSRW